MTASPLASPLAPPHALRRLREGEGPYPGELIAGDPPRVWVDAAVFGDSPAFAADPAGHLLAPLDIARTVDGHAVILAQCTRRLRDAVDSGIALTPGEAVTVAVSLLRGSVEAAMLGAIEGQWWVTVDGRPVLAVRGTHDWREEAAAVLVTLSVGATPALSDALATCRDAVLSVRAMSDRVLGIEDALFAVADPAALGSSISPAPRPVSLNAVPGTAPVRPGPVRAREVTPSGAGLREPPTDRADPPGVGMVRAWLSRLVDSGVADRVGDALRDLRHPRRSVSAPSPAASRVDRPPAASPSPPTAPPVSPPRRRAPWLIAAMLVIVITAVGVLWPTGEDVRRDPHEPGAASAPSAPVSAPSPAAAGVEAAPLDSADRDATAPNATDPKTTDPNTTDPKTTVPKTTVPESTVPADDLEAQGRAVVEALSSCTEAKECAVWEDPARSIAPGVATAPDAERTVSVVEEYGGVAVLRVEAPELSPQIVVIVRDGKTWLARDVYDVAGQ